MALGLAFLGLIPSIQSTGGGSEVAPPKASTDLVREGSKDLYVLAHPEVGGGRVLPRDSHQPACS